MVTLSCEDCEVPDTHEMSKQLLSVTSLTENEKRLEMCQISSEGLGSRSFSRNIKIIDPKCPWRSFAARNGGFFLPTAGRVFRRSKRCEPDLRSTKTGKSSYAALLSHCTGPKAGGAKSEISVGGVGTELVPGKRSEMEKSTIDHLAVKKPGTRMVVQKSW